MTARAQPFSINIVDEVKPFESTRPGRKPRNKGTGQTSSAARRSTTSLDAFGPSPAKSRPSTPPKELTLEPTGPTPTFRTRHYSLRLEPIRLGPAPPSTTETETVSIWRERCISLLKDLLRPVVISAERRQKIIGFGLAFMITASLTFAGLHEAIRTRQISGARMSQIEQQIAVRTHNVSVRARDVNEARIIDNTNVGSRDLDRVLADLAWTESARSPEARLRSWRWTPDQLVVETNRPAGFAGSDRSVRHRTGAAKRGLWTFVIVPSAAGRPKTSSFPTGRLR